MVTLTYGIRRSRLRPNRPSLRRLGLRTLAVFIGVLACYAAVGFLVPAQSGWSVSTRSGVTESHGVYELPFTGVVVRRSATLAATAVSTVLAKHGVRQGGPPAFAFVQETGRTPFGAGRSCALGEGGRCIAAIRSPDVAAFLDALLSYASRSEADRWVGRTLDPSTSEAVRIAVILSEFPAAGFPDQSHFSAWWTKAEPKIESDFRKP